MDNAYVIRFNDSSGYVHFTRTGKIQKVNLAKADMFETYEEAKEARSRDWEITGLFRITHTRLISVK